MKKIDFLATDGLKLNGLLYESNQKTDKVILSVHGMSSNCLKNREDILSKCMNQNNIDYFCFNNRGSELVRYIQKDINGEKEKLLGGTTYEDVLEGYEDIVGAILKLRELGYKEIYLQGHSLGCTKIVYTYNELKEEEENVWAEDKNTDLGTEEEKEGSTYFDRTEHDWIASQEMGSTILRETENLWTPMKRFLHRRRKPKWGDWDGLYIEEEDL